MKFSKKPVKLVIFNVPHALIKALIVYNVKAIGCKHRIVYAIDTITMIYNLLIVRFVIIDVIDVMYMVV